MHPDLHPDQDKATKDLFKRAIIAYKEFDLKTLRETDAMLSTEISAEAETTVEALMKEKDRLLKLIRAVSVEIRAIKGKYPYTMKELLEDPLRLAAEKQRLQQKLEHIKASVKVYRERIVEMRRSNGESRSDRQ